MSGLASKPEKFDNTTEVDVWMEQLKIYFLVNGIKDEEMKKNLLLSFLDPQIFKSVVKGLQENKRTFQSITRFLDERYNKNDDYMDRISFFERKYSSSPDSFASEITAIFDRFNNDNLRDEILVAKFITAVSEDVQKELRLRRPSSLNQCVQIMNSLSTSGAVSCAAMKSRNDNNNIKPSNRNQVACYKCGSLEHLSNNPLCPAIGSKCSNCGKLGHYGKVCFSKTFNSGNQNFRTKNPRVGSIKTEISTLDYKCCPRSILCKTKRPEITITVYGTPCSVLVDTGSEVSVLSEADFVKLNNIRKLRPLNCINFSNADGSNLNMKGWITNNTVEFKNRVSDIDFMVGDIPKSIAGVDIISALKISIDYVDSDYGEQNSNCSKELKHCTDIFSLEAEIHLKSDAASSCIQKLRRLPFSVRGLVEEEIRNLLAKKVIEPIEFSPYVSPVVVVHKPNGKIRLCVDFRKINDLILIDQCQLTTAEEIFTR